MLLSKSWKGIVDIELTPLCSGPQGAKSWWCPRDIYIMVVVRRRVRVSVGGGRRLLLLWWGCTPGCPWARCDPTGWRRLLILCRVRQKVRSDVENDNPDMRSSVAVTFQPTVSTLQLFRVHCILPIYLLFLLCEYPRSSTVQVPWRWRSFLGLHVWPCAWVCRPCWWSCNCRPDQTRPINTHHLLYTACLIGKSHFESSNQSTQT